MSAVAFSLTLRDEYSKNIIQRRGEFQEVSHMRGTQITDVLPPKMLPDNSVCSGAAGARARTFFVIVIVYVCGGGCSPDKWELARFFNIATGRSSLTEKPQKLNSANEAI